MPAACPYPEPARCSPYPPTSHLPKIDFNIILPSTSGSPKWSLSLRFPHPHPVYPSPIPHACYMPIPFAISGVHVTMAWRVLRLRMEERPPILRLAANILTKQSRTADEGWSSSLRGLGEVLTTPRRKTYPVTYHLQEYLRT